MQSDRANQLTGNLQAVRRAAIDVHGSLLELTRREYERENGRISDSATLLKLITTEPAFAWLNPLTALIADIDEVLHDHRLEARQRIPLLLRAVEDLLRADESGSYFQRRYLAAIQASPDVAVDHRRTISQLRSKPLTWT
jgi:hypothetical protein